jgi:hypothetical protein
VLCPSPDDTVRAQAIRPLEGTNRPIGFGPKGAVDRNLEQLLEDRDVRSTIALS